MDDLAVEDCAQLAPEALLPLAPLGSKLRSLSLAGICLLTDDALVQLLASTTTDVESVSLRGCALLGPDGVAAVAKACPRLRSLDLEGIELLTDETLGVLAEQTPALEEICLKRCVQVSDAGIEALASGCPGLSRLSLNNIPALGDLSLVALRKHCARSLTDIDLSWCRGVTDNGVGSLVDASFHLSRLSIWGCSQLTRLFFNGHRRDELTIVGRFIGTEG